jgi:hypothetical protein
MVEWKAAITLFYANARESVTDLSFHGEPVTEPPWAS